MQRLSTYSGEMCLACALPRSTCRQEMEGSTYILDLRKSGSEKGTMRT